MGIKMTLDTKIILDKIKTISVLLLTALCIYQTGVLWFVNITNRNFLLNYFPFLQQAAIPEGFDNFIVPWRVFSALPDGSFSVRYKNLTHPDNDHYADMILSQLMTKGSFVDSYPLDNENILSFLAYPVFVYEYAFSMKAEWFSLGFGQRSGLLSRHGLETFRRVFIRPPDQYGFDAHVFFLCDEAYVYEFTVTLLLGGRHILTSADMDYSAHASEEAGPVYRFVPLAKGGHFIPYGEFEFYKLNITNPYADSHGVFALDFVRERVAGFFSNPAAIRTIVDSAVWVYRDVNTVVRYYDSHILEYLSYRAIDRSGSPSFISDFNAALQFIERDHLVTNDIYLAGFREDGDLHVFYFNYSINNTAIVMTDTALSPRLEHPIVVTVDHGTVVRYRKLAFNFNLDKRQPVLAYADFHNKLHRFDGDFTDVRLAYRVTEDAVAMPYWFMDGRAVSAVRRIQ